MLKFQCSCGCEDFAVNRHCSAIRCWDCRKKYSLEEDAWTELKIPIRERAQEAAKELIEHFTHSAESRIETTGEFFKRLGIERIKKEKIIVKKNFSFH